MSRMIKFSMLVIVVLLIAASTYAFAAANVVPATMAGDASGAVTGYTIDNIAYVLDTTDASKLDHITLQTYDKSATPVLADAAQVKIRLVAGGPTWYSCTSVVDQQHWTCDTADFAVATIDTLEVVATSN